MFIPVSWRSSWKNLWLKINATPLISSTLASAVVFLFLKLAVMAMASFPLNSLRLKPALTSRESLAHFQPSLNPAVCCTLIGLSRTVSFHRGPITWQCVPSSICSNDDIELQLIDRMRLGLHLHSPAYLCKGTQVMRNTPFCSVRMFQPVGGALTLCALVLRWLHQVFKLHIDVDLDPQQ